MPLQVAEDGRTSALSKKVKPVSARSGPRTVSFPTLALGTVFSTLEPTIVSKRNVLPFVERQAAFLRQIISFRPIVRWMVLVCITVY